METLSVMVVDDEAGMRAGTVRTLKDYRFKVGQTDSDVAFAVSQAETGEEALDKIKADPPDILLLDHKLPGISGMEVLQKLPQTDGGVITIMITAYASIETAVQATKQGAYDFLPKPFTPAELKYAVQKAASHVVIARRAQKLAEEKKRVRFEFIRVLGHELKSPLSAVENYVSLLQAKTLGGELKAYENVIERSRLRLEQMRKLIVDLLDVTKIESGTRAREIADLDLREVAAHVIETSEPLAAQRGITITLTAPPALKFRGDRTELEMILGNLVSNAVKYNRDQGKVSVTLEDRPGLVHIAVADTGIGMSKQEASRLFEEFVRIKNEKTRNVLGSGLGLSIVKRLAGLYRGEVAVESEPDAGSTFTVTLKPGDGDGQPVSAAVV